MTIVRGKFYTQVPAQVSGRCVVGGGWNIPHYGMLDAMEPRRLSMSWTEILPPSENPRSKDSTSLSTARGTVGIGSCRVLSRVLE